MLLLAAGVEASVIEGELSDAVAAPRTNRHVCQLLHAAVHAVYEDPTATGMHDYSTTRRDATGAVDAPGTDHGICVSTVDSHRRRESGMARAASTNKRIVGSLVQGLNRRESGASKWNSVLAISRAVRLSDEQRGLSILLAGMCGYSRLNLRFHRLHVEACTFLHRRELNEALGGLCDLLLHEYEAPKLISEPIVIGERPPLPVREARSLIRV
jgi:hypothetical protein